MVYAGCKNDILGQILHGVFSPGEVLATPQYCVCCDLFSYNKLMVIRPWIHIQSNYTICDCISTWPDSKPCQIKKHQGKNLQGVKMYWTYCMARNFVWPSCLTEWPGSILIQPTINKHFFWFYLQYKNILQYINILDDLLGDVNSPKGFEATFAAVCGFKTKLETMGGTYTHCRFDIYQMPKIPKNT